MANRFILNPVLYYGNGAIKEIPGIAQREGFKKVFVASDPDLVKFGITAKVTALLDEAGIDYSVYSDIKPNNRGSDHSRYGSGSNDQLRYHGRREGKKVRMR